MNEIVQRPLQSVQRRCGESSEGKVLGKIIDKQRDDQEV